MFNKWKRLFFYIKTIKKNIDKIRNHFILQSELKPYQITDIKLDRAYRLYTVVNMKPETEENMRKYGYYLLDNEVKKFISELNTKIKDIGLLEDVGLSRADQIDTSSVLIVVEFKHNKITKILRNLLILTFLLLSTLFILFF